MTINHSELLSVVPGGAGTQHHVDDANHTYLTSTEESKKVGITLNGTLSEHATAIDGLKDGTLIEDNAIKANHITNASVSLAKINPAGAAEGQVLGISGGAISWNSLSSKRTPFFMMNTPYEAKFISKTWPLLIEFHNGLKKDLFSFDVGSSGVLAGNEDFLRVSVVVAPLGSGARRTYQSWQTGFLDVLIRVYDNQTNYPSGTPDWNFEILTSFINKPASWRVDNQSLLRSVSLQLLADDPQSYVSTITFGVSLSGILHEEMSFYHLSCAVENFRRYGPSPVVSFV